MRTRRSYVVLSKTRDDEDNIVPTGATVFLGTINYIRVEFLDHENIAVPNHDINYHIEIDYNSPKIGIHIIMDTNFNYKVHPHVVSGSVGGGGVHVKVKLSKRDYMHVYQAVKDFLETLY